MYARVCARVKKSRARVRVCVGARKGARAKNRRRNARKRGCFVFVVSFRVMSYYVNRIMSDIFVLPFLHPFRVM